MQQLVTVSTIVDGLADLGVVRSDRLLVHCALSSFGRIQGGAQAVIEALEQAVGSTGTLVMPCLLYTSPSPRDGLLSRMPSSA